MRDEKCQIYFTAQQIQTSLLNLTLLSPFDNGMVLWLAKEGETFELSSYDWAKIQQINAMVRTLGIFKDRYLTQNEIKKEEEKEKNSISYKIRKALEKWAKLIRIS